MKTLATKEDLQYLIENRIEENFELEYKESRALGRQDRKILEIAKDVSAMANSAGGILIYGIAEDGHFPESITPIDNNDYSKEWLENIITSNISPKIADLQIITIAVDNGFVYVVKIPQSAIAHQNTRDYKYYKRRNFKVDPMLDYEIKDIMNRAKYPVIELEFEIEEKEDYSKKYDSYIMEDAPIYDPKFFLKVRAINKGKVYANFVNYFVELPIDLLLEEDSSHLKKIEKDVVEYYGENTFKDSPHDTSRFDPILPSLYSRSEKILLNIKSECNIKPSKLDSREIRWRVYADNAPIQEGSITLSAINIVKK